MAPTPIHDKMIDHSFAVMAYEDSPYLSECLDSLKKQTVESVIYISTSTPSTYITEIAKKYGIEVFVTEPGLGIANDWNFSVQMAKTKYVTLAHQDDTYIPRYAECCFNAAEKFKDTLICFPNYEELVNGKNRTGTLLLIIKQFILFFFMPIKKNLHNKYWKKYFLSFGSAIPCPAVMYNMENLREFLFAHEYSINLDWDAWLRMAMMKGRFVYVSSALMKHRIHAESATTVGLKDNARQNEDLKMFSRIWPYFIAKILSKFYSSGYKSNVVEK